MCKRPILWSLVTLLGMGTTLVAYADIRIFACEPEWAALAEEIGGERVEVTAAVTAFQDPHYIEARPSLIAATRRADLVVCTGADLEIAWLPLLLRQSGNPRVQVGEPGHFVASEHVDLRERPASVDRALGDMHPYGNPHIQTDPRNIAAVAEALAGRMASLDPDNADYYLDRHRRFEERWNAAIRDWTERLRPVQGAQVITHHRSWPYLMAWAGLVEAGNLEPKPGVPPSASDLARLLDRVENLDVRLIIRSAYQSGRPSEWLSDRTGIPAIVLPQTVGAEGAEDLFSLFDTIVTRLLEAAS